jgi:magnesium transporter
MTPGGGHQSNSRLRLVQETGSPHSDHFEPAGERAPLLSSSMRVNTDPSRAFPAYGSNGSRPDISRQPSRDSRHLAPQFGSGYHVNYPPSMPGTPPLGATDGRDLNLSLGDVMLRDEDEDRGLCSDTEDLTRPSLQSSFARRHTIALQAEEDVCFPQEGMSEMADDEQTTLADESTTRGVRRRRRGKWPDLAILEEWSRLEKEGRSEERRVKRITEPQLINGRLRPTNGHKGWYRSDEDAPYRFTYFNEEFPSTIHSQTISELVQPGGSFRELFIPDRLVLSDSESETSEDEEAPPQLLDPFDKSDNAFKSSDSRDLTRQPSLVMSSISKQTSDVPSKENTGPPTRTSTPAPGSHNQSGDATPSGAKSPAPGIKSPLQVQVKPPKPIRYGERPVWWLDILCPTEAEMRVLQKAFAIHPLTSEDIMMQEQREKVECLKRGRLQGSHGIQYDVRSVFSVADILGLACQGLN